MFDPHFLDGLTAFVQVVLIDVALAGDNAVVVGMAVTGLPAQQQRRAILLGIVAATLIRVALGAVTLQLLDIIGLTLAGGLLLLWVCWKMFRELTHRPGHGAARGAAKRKTLRQAILQILLADLSMSLDNVLAVAGAAEDSLVVLVAGLTISVALMGLAAGVIARVLENNRWIAWVGLGIVLYVALKMIWEGTHEVVSAVQ